VCDFADTNAPRNGTDGPVNQSNMSVGSQPDPGYSAMVEGPTEGRKTIDCAAQRAAGTQPREGRLFRPSLGESR
jgi:hypothetical protein